MESFFSRYKSALVLLLVLLAQVIGLASQMRRRDYTARADGHNVRIVRGWAAYTITPVESLLRHMGGGVRGMWTGYIDLRHVRQHDKDLQYQINQLRLQEASLAEDARQGQRLQRLLDFKQHYVGRTIAAEVVGTGGGDQSRLLVIDKGWTDGVRPDMAVITPDGAVGKVRDVFAQSSQVLLLNDVSSGAGVILTGTRTRGIVHGDAAGELEITNLLPDERIKAGEPLITSGGDRVFPRGLPVGNVVFAKPDPEHQPYALIRIKPAANLNRLEEVLIVANVDEQLAKGGGDPDDPEEGKKASEIVADRLPGLKEPAKAEDNDAPKPPGATDAQPGVNLPKPPPAIHTDRYTPGAIPPASALQPGQQDTDLQTPVTGRSTPRREEQP